MKKHSLLKKFSAIATTTALILTSIPLNSAISASAADKRGRIYHYLAKGARQDVVDELVKGIEQGKASIDIHRFKIYPEEMEAIAADIGNCHPELFYFDMEMSVSADAYVWDVYPEYNCDVDDIPALRARYDAEINDIMSKINDSMSDIEKAVVLHDEIIIRGNYAYRSSPYELLVNGYGQCIAYSKVYAYLLSLAGIDNEIVDSEPMYHSWNKVCIDGTYYNVDVTWDDPVISSSVLEDGTYDFVDSLGHASHNYFMRSDYDFKYDTSLPEPHYDYNCIFESPSTYDNRMYKNIDTKLCYENGAMYYIDNSISLSEKLYKYDIKSDTATLVNTFSNRWTTGTPNRFWVEGFMSLDSLADVLYYNSSDAVYSYDLRTGEEKLFSDNAALKDKCYGIKILNGGVYAALKTAPHRKGEWLYLGEVIREPEPTTILPTEPPTTVEPTTVPPTTAKPTTIPPTTAKPTTIPPTTAKPTTVPPTTAKPTTVPPTTAKPTTVPPTTAKPTTVPPTTAKPTTVPPTTAKPTTVPPTTAKPTTKPTTVPPTTAKPTTIPSTTTEPPELLYKYGDVNRDGRLSVRDATALQFAIAELEPIDDMQKILGDVNGDGMISIKDVTLLQYRIAEIIKKFPVEE